MKWFGCTLGGAAVVALSLASYVQAQSSTTNTSNRNGENGTTERRSAADRSTKQDDDIRIRYDDRTDRFSIDADEEVQFRRGNDEGWASGGDFEARYDADANDLDLRGEGTIDVDKVGQNIAHWWQVWWKRERDNRRTVREGVERGAHAFLKQYDKNDDNYLSRQELPQQMRAEFENADDDDNNYLSVREISQLGAQVYNNQRSVSDRNQYAGRTSSTDNQDDQTWSQWWSSWWSDDAQRGQNAEGSQGGAHRLLRLYDRNDNDTLSRSELPARMRDDFARVDRDSDGYLDREELRQHGDMLRDESRRTIRNDDDRYASDNSNDRSWNQWWNSWFEENPNEQRDAIITNGSSEFIRRHDKNDDGYLVRSELPSRMYDDFESIDRNDDRYLTRREIQHYAGDFDYRPRGDKTTRDTNRNQQPAQAVAFWVVDVDNGQLELNELQQAYDRLRKIDQDKNGEISRSELSDHRENTK